MDIGISTLRGGSCAAWLQLEPCMFVQTIRAISLLLALAALPARAWATQPQLSPVSPKGGDTVSVTFTSGHCDLLGEPTVNTSGNHVNFSIFSVLAGDYEACIYPTVARSYVLGTFSPGTYIVQVDRTYWGDNDLETHPMATLNLVVTEEASISNVPALGLIGSAGMALALACAAAIRKRSNGTKQIILFVAGFCPIAAIYAAPQNPSIEILLNAGPSFPTPQYVVDQFRLASPGSPPAIPGLAAGSPTGVTYLMPIRAVGDFLSWIQENPDAQRSRLERYLVVFYPEGTDLQEPLAALQADSNVAGASIVQEASFSAADASSILVPGKAIFAPSSYSQYGRDQLNIPATWQMAGGYAPPAICQVAGILS